MATKTVTFSNVVGCVQEPTIDWTKPIRSKLWKRPLRILCTDAGGVLPIIVQFGAEDAYTIWALDRFGRADGRVVVENYEDVTLKTITPEGLVLDLGEKPDVKFIE